MIVIIDYGMGNTGSVKNALEFLGADVLVSNNRDDVKMSSHLILPGVGSFGDGISNLKESGLANILEEEVLRGRKPFLGICLGMQLLADEGDEGGVNKGLGWIHGRTVKIRAGIMCRTRPIRFIESSTSDRRSLKKNPARSSQSHQPSM